jgi:hypothetical protein
LISFLCSSRVHSNKENLHRYDWIDLLWFKTPDQTTINCSLGFHRFIAYDSKRFTIKSREHVSSKGAGSISITLICFALNHGARDSPWMLAPISPRYVRKRTEYKGDRKVIVTSHNSYCRLQHQCIDAKQKQRWK